MGLTITLAKDFAIVVTDDVPLLTGITDTSGSVAEGALSSGSPGDLYGNGDEHMGVAAAVSDSLSGLVAFGADGPALDGAHGKDGFQFAVATDTAHDFGVTSHGQAVDFVTLSAVTDGAHGASQTLTAWTGGGAGHEVFTLTLNGDGTYSVHAAQSDRRRTEPGRELGDARPVEPRAGDGLRRRRGRARVRRFHDHGQ